MHLLVFGSLQKIGERKMKHLVLKNEIPCFECDGLMCAPVADCHVCKNTGLASPEAIAKRVAENELRNERVFCGYYPTGIVWADRHQDDRGDYKTIAYLNYDTLVLEVRDACPTELLDIIQNEAKWYQERKGESFQVTQTQFITLGRYA
jgi:hypothetical protein